MSTGAHRPWSGPAPRIWLTGHLPGPGWWRTYQEDFARAARKAGLPPEFIPHSLRHCFASTALANGIPITEVSQWLGHRSIELTHRIYGHLVPSSWGRALAVLDQAFLDGTA